MTKTGGPGYITPGEDIIRRTAAAFGLTVADLRSPSRRREHTEPRFAAYWLLRKHPTAAGLRRSFPEIGRMLGGKDHSSVMHGIERAEDIMARCPDYAARVRALDEGKAVYGPPRPLDRKDRPPVWNKREEEIVARVKPLAEARDDEPLELSTLSHKAAMARGSFALAQAMRREASAQAMRAA